MRRLIVALAIATPLIGASTADAQYQSRQERQYQNLNRSMRQQQDMQQQRQQNRFEFNQMQQNMQRDQLFTMPPPGPNAVPYRR